MAVFEKDPFPLRSGFGIFEYSCDREFILYEFAALSHPGLNVG